MVTPGIVVGYSICSTSNNTLTGAIQLNLFVNGVENVNYQLTKPANVYSAAKMFDKPLE